MPTAYLTHPEATYRRGLHKHMGKSFPGENGELIPRGPSMNPVTVPPRRAWIGGGTRSGFPVVELVSALRVRLNQADDVMLPEEAEPTVPDLYRGQEVPKVDPPVRVHLEAVSFREVPQDAGHRPSEDLDLFVVQEEFALVPAMGTELLAEVTMRTTFLQHRPLLGCLVFAVGL